MRKLQAVLGTCVLLAAGSLALGEQYLGVTVPVHDVTINFTRPGRVVEIVEFGDHVSKGQIIAKLDDSEEQKALEKDQAKADDQTKVAAQDAIRDHAKANLEKIQHGHELGAASVFELHEAELNLLVEEAKVKLTAFEQKMDKVTAQQTAIAVSKMVIKSPLDGRVEKHFVEVGESVEPATKVLRLIDRKQLRAEAPVPYAQASKLKIGDKGTVTFSDGSAIEGKVIFIAEVADPGAATLLVRVEIENDWKRRAGDRVKVEFPALASIAGK